MDLFSKKEYKGKLVWENVKNKNVPYTSRRTKINGGWLFYSSDGIGSGVTFIPDPEHKWNGSSK